MLLFEPAPDGTALRADLDNSQRETLHLWRVYLREEPSSIRQLSCLLRTEERERAARFVTEPLRARFTVCRAALRTILAGYLSVGPLEVEFCQSSSGKPYLADMRQGSMRNFNVSHSQDLAIVAICGSREVGIDVEAIRSIMDVHRLVDRCLGPFERLAYDAENTVDRTELFLRYWTHKEAFLKAVGAGLQIPLDTVEFDLEAEGAQRVVRFPNELSERYAEIYLAGFCPDEGYCGAWAVEGSAPLELRCWQWRC